MFKFLLAMILFIFIICMILEFFVFLFDVKKWHDAEERINIVPSASVAEPAEHEGSEVSESESDDRQRDSSTISFSWRES